MIIQNKRRLFLKAGFLSTAVFVMSGCDLFTITTPQDTIEVLQYDLFPMAKTLNIDTVVYMNIILHHSRIIEEEKTYIKNSVKWLNEEALKLHKNSYTKLLSTQRKEVLNSIKKSEWGENFMYDMTRYLFEAMFGDPIYGANKNESGWKWIEFKGGEPRPKKAYL